MQWPRPIHYRGNSPFGRGLVKRRDKTPFSGPRKGGGERRGNRVAALATEVAPSRGANSIGPPRSAQPRDSISGVEISFSSGERGARSPLYRPGAKSRTVSSLLFSPADIARQLARFQPPA